MDNVSQPNQIIRTIKAQTEWKNELLQAQNEVDYFLDVLNDLKSRTIGDSHKSLIVAQFVQDFHHYQRLTKRMLDEIGEIRHEMAEEIQTQNLIDAESMRDQRYFKAEMRDFQKNYKETKYKFRAFVAGFEYLTDKETTL